MFPLPALEILLRTLISICDIFDIGLFEKSCRKFATPCNAPLVLFSFLQLKNRGSSIRPRGTVSGTPQGRLAEAGPRSC